MARARKAAETAEAEATAAGKEKREELVAQAKRDIEAETRRSLQQIRKEVADLTVLATEKVTRKSLNADDQRRLVEEALSEVDFTSLSGAERTSHAGGRPRIRRRALRGRQGEGQARRDRRAARPVRRRASTATASCRSSSSAPTSPRPRRSRGWSGRSPAPTPELHQLPRAADREAPDAGDLPHPPPVRGALEAGEQAARRDRHQRRRARPGGRREDRRGGRTADRRRRSSSPAASTTRSSAASSCRSATWSSTRASAVAWRNFERASRRRRKEAIEHAMEIKPDEIASILRERIEGMDTASRRPLRGRHRAVRGRRHRPHPRPRQLHGAGDARAAARGHRAGAQPRGRQRRRRALRRVGQDRRGRHGQADRPPAADPGRRRAARPHGRPARPPARRQGRDRHHRDPPGRVQSPRRRPAPAGRPSRSRPA